MTTPSSPTGFPARVCPSCEGTIFDTLFTQAFAPIDGRPGIDGYDVVACAACGMVYASGIPSQATLHTYYAAHSKYEYPQRDGAESEWDRTRFRQVADHFTELYPDREAAILDVGCATGGLLEELRRRGYANLSGLDPSLACAEVARARGHHVMCGSVASLFTVESVARFDVILLIGVLEHIREVRGTLTMIRNLLKPGGALYVEVPDARGFADFHDAPFQAFSTEHINFFTMWSLNRTLALAGFQVVDQLEDSREQSATVTMSNVSTMAIRHDRPSVTGPDRSGRHAIRRYVQKCQREEATLRATIEAMVADESPVILWGAGTFSRRLLATTSLARIVAAPIIDVNPHLHGMRVAGKPIESPESLRRTVGPAWPIIIASAPFEREIREAIAALVIPNPVDVLRWSPP